MGVMIDGVYHVEDPGPDTTEDGEFRRRKSLIRDWIDGSPIHIARPSTREWYTGAHRILREMRRRGITHNDLAKPQNWLMRPDGEPAVIDFQLASASTG